MKVKYILDLLDKEIAKMDYIMDFSPEMIPDTEQELQEFTERYRQLKLWRYNLISIASKEDA